MKFSGQVTIGDDAPSSDSLQILSYYVAKQLDSMFPSAGVESDAQSIYTILPAVINRLKPILRSVRCFSSMSFEYFNSLQYSTFLYILANEHSKMGFGAAFSDRLFCLNRALNSIDLFYAVEMPEVFFISHGLGTVLGNAKYGDRLVVFQNVTVGRVGDSRPIIGDDVILYPGAIITGKSVIGNNCVVSAGSVLHNIVVPGHTIVKSHKGCLTFEKNKRNHIDLYLERY
jgi:serine O-acetyltransferase